MATLDKALKETGVSIKTTATKTKYSKKISELPFFTTFFAPLAVGNQQYIPEPKTEEQRRIYASQVLIPVFVSRKNHALSGSLDDLDIDSSKLREFFSFLSQMQAYGASEKP